MAATEESLIAQDILSYLVENTSAEDTIDGIVEWWLLQEKIKHRMKEVQKVLDELVVESLIVVRKSKDSKIRYRINKGKMREIQALLKEIEGQRG
jgi:metal-responsive CopG/Arc/MetJ family transcriptional regulator